MKNKVKFIGIIAFVVIIGLLFVGCGEKGGSLEIKNETGGKIVAFASETEADVVAKLAAYIASANKTENTVENGGSKSFSISEAGDMWYFWYAIDIESVGDGLPIPKKVSIAKGETKPITAKDQKYQ